MTSSDDGAQPGPGSQSSLRTTNAQRVLSALRSGTPLTQADVARTTGLAPSTVSSIVTSLRGLGVVEPAQGPTGRRGAEIHMMPRAGFLLGIDAGARHLTVALTGLDGQETGRRTTVLRPGHRWADTAALLESHVDALLAEAGAPRDQVLGAGVSVPAPVDADGRLHNAASFMSGWAGVDVAAELTTRLGVETLVENDANLGALGEYFSGAGQGVGTLLMLKMSHGVGGGIVINGVLHRGHHGTAGELGHVPADPDGRLCRCGGRGCLETRVGTDAVLSLLEPVHGRLDLAAVAALAQAGDVGVLRVLSDVGRVTGRVLAAVCALVAPDRVVVGGALPAVSPVLLESLRETLLREALPAATEGLEVVPAALGEDAPLAGAVALALRSADDRLAALAAATA